MNLEFFNSRFSFPIWVQYGCNWLEPGGHNRHCDTPWTRLILNVVHEIHNSNHGTLTKNGEQYTRQSCL